MATLRTFAKQNRGPGRITTAATDIPAGADKVLRVRANLTQAQLDNAATVCTIGMETRISTGPDVYQEDVAFPFVGGPNQGRFGGVTPPPSFNVNLADYAGKTVRAFLVLPNQLNIGGFIETVAE